jgi:hypothetical protein
MPHAADLLTGAALALVAALLLGMGRLAAGRDTLPEVALVAGWGVLCLVLTVWGAALSASMVIPTAIFAAAALLGLRGGMPGLGRACLLSLPLWLVMLAARPSQIDTWLNLLPNLAYLVDHGAFPHDGGPESWSFLPAAPYNTQFVGFAVSLLTRSLAANALSLFNVLLVCAAGLHLARVCARPGPPPWWALAAGFLLAVPLNPGFTPRIFFASYGEAPLAVTLLFAVSLGVDLLEEARAGQPRRSTLPSLCLVLAAMVEIKQSALGLLLPFAGTLLALGLLAPGVARARWAAAVAGASAPALALYLLWRWFVLGHFAVGELKMLPLADWHLNLLPAILAGIAFAIFEKATYFVAVAILLTAAVLEARRHPWQRAAMILALGAGLVAGFTGFLLFTYVAHFPAIWAINAHSYFRYMSQLSLVVMLGLVTWLRPAAATWIAKWSEPARHRARITALGLAALLPLAAAPLLRFDLDAPQPFLWNTGHRAASLLGARDRVAIIAPHDGDDAVGSYWRGVLLFTDPRRPALDFTHETAASPAALEHARAAGFTRALVSCAPAGLAGLPPGTAGLLAWDAGAWHPIATWPIPPSLRRARFSAMLPKPAFCP